MATSSLPVRRPHPATLVLAGGLVAGTFDIVYACVFWALKRDVPVERILQSVAAGLLGKASFEGGVATATLGLLLYGIMNYVVVPLSRAGPGSKDPLWIGLSIAVHAFLIGVPIALFARRAVTVSLPSLLTTKSRRSD